MGSDVTTEVLGLFDSKTSVQRNPQRVKPRYNGPKKLN